jgi:RNA polymerase sigma-70 factor (ECF subfamily)
MEGITAIWRLTAVGYVEAMQLCAVTSDFPIDDRTIEACQRGDSEGFRLLFEVYKDRVYSIALYYFNGDEASAHDITQQVFLKLLTHISQFESRSEFSTWLYRMVANACLDRKRALRRFLSLDGSREYDIPEPRRSIEDKVIQREREVSIRSAISSLKPKLRMAILLKHFEELSYDEIAGVLGCSKGTVASRLNRGHQILARKLAHLRGEFPGPSGEGTMKE